MKQARS